MATVITTSRITLTISRIFNDNSPVMLLVVRQKLHCVTGSCELCLLLLLKHVLITGHRANGAYRRSSYMWLDVRKDVRRHRWRGKTTPAFPWVPPAAPPPHRTPPNLTHRCRRQILTQSLVWIMHRRLCSLGTDMCAQTHDIVYSARNAPLLLITVSHHCDVTQSVR